MVFSLVLIAAGAIVLLLYFICSIKTKIDRKTSAAEAEEEKRRRDAAIGKLQTPEEIKAFFSEISEKRPSLSSSLEGLTNQLDTINRQKEKLDRLLKMNNLLMFENTKELLCRIEDSICINCRKAANECIVNDGNDEAVKENIVPICKDGDEKLEQVQKYLNELVKYTNSQDSDSDAEKTLKVCCDTIRQSLEKI